jgi:hypothetical protein
VNTDDSSDEFAPFRVVEALSDREDFGLAGLESGSRWRVNYRYGRLRR